MEVPVAAVVEAAAVGRAPLAVVATYEGEPRAVVLLHALLEGLAGALTRTGHGEWFVVPVAHALIPFLLVLDSPARLSDEQVRERFERCLRDARPLGAGFSIGAADATGPACQPARMTTLRLMHLTVGALGKRWRVENRIVMHSGDFQVDNSPVALARVRLRPEVDAGLLHHLLMLTVAHHVGGRFTDGVLHVPAAAPWVDAQRAGYPVVAADGHLVLRGEVLCEVVEG